MIRKDNLLLRCHMLGDVITKTGNFTETAKKACVKILAAQGFDRHDELKSKYLVKGKQVEEDSLTLYTSVVKEFFRKNTTRHSNAFITGEYDTDDGKKVIEHITDIKSSYSLPTFLENAIKDVKHTNYWQGQGYMMLTGAKRYTVANCLVNSPAHLIVKEKYNKSFEPGMLDDDGNESPEYVETCKLIERNHIFDIKKFKKVNPGFEWHSTEFDFDIPEELRVIRFDFERNEYDIAKIEATVKMVRDYLFDVFPKYFLP